ncbi:MAG: FkbM family methyltransferase [Geminicoccaceae bacterium]
MPAAPDGLSVTRTALPSGGLLYFATDPADAVVGAEIRERGWWQGTETQLVFALVGPGDRAVDAGAHVGYFTVIMARCAGPLGRVDAFEPEPRNFEFLKANCILNGASHVRPHRLALGVAAGQADLCLGGGNAGDHRLHPTPGRPSVRVGVTRLDNVLDGARIDFLKIDTQGGEAAILEGAEATIRASAARLAVLLELSPRLSEAAGYGRDALLDLLDRLKARAFTATIPPRPLAPDDVAEMWDRLHATGVEEANAMLLLAFSRQAARRITAIRWPAMPPA